MGRNCSLDNAKNKWISNESIVYRWSTARNRSSFGIIFRNWVNSSPRSFPPRLVARNGRGGLPVQVRRRPPSQEYIIHALIVLLSSGRRASINLARWPGVRIERALQQLFCWITLDKNFFNQAAVETNFRKSFQHPVPRRGNPSGKRNDALLIV